LAPDTVTLEAVLVPQLLPTLLTGHQHVQVADGELQGPRGKCSQGHCAHLPYLPVIITVTHQSKTCLLHSNKCKREGSLSPEQSHVKFLWIFFQPLISVNI
jgi:hypothetical protein